MSLIPYNETVSISAAGGGVVAGQFNDVGNNDLQIMQAIAASLTNSPTGITFNGANLQAIILLATQDLTLKINSYSSPFATINLKAGIPFHWSAAAGYFANPLNVSVTEIYVTSTTPCLLKGRVLTN